MRPHRAERPSRALDGTGAPCRSPPPRRAIERGETDARSIGRAAATPRARGVLDPRAPPGRSASISTRRAADARMRERTATPRCWREVSNDVARKEFLPYQRRVTVMVHSWRATGRRANGRRRRADERRDGDGAALRTKTVAMGERRHGALCVCVCVCPTNDE